ncbi:MAG: CPBP family intramembrane glutamic endopeptidase [Ktedonobacterales bacterium]
MRSIIHATAEVIRRHAVLAYFGLVLLISYGSFALLEGPTLLRGGSTQQATTEYALFPILVLSVAIVGLALAGVVAGRCGVRDVFARVGKWRVGVRWYAIALLLPPAGILVTLLVMRTFVSPTFTPNVFALGFLFGLPGFLEEIGWMGFAFPQMRKRQSALAAAVTLGVLWGLWHAPVVDYLGAAAPHKAYWPLFFLSFIAIVAAMRVLIVWVYSNTGGSLLLAQLMHISMTGSLVMFDPLGLTPAQETLWYALYAALLWVIVGVVALRSGKRLVRGQAPAHELEPAHA